MHRGVYQSKSQMSSSLRRYFSEVFGSFRQTSEPLPTSVEHMSIIYDSTQWMIWADKCLIEKVEKNPHKPPNYSVFMFGVGPASKTALSDHSTDSLTERERCRTISISDDWTLELFCKICWCYVKFMWKTVMLTRVCVCALWLRNCFLCHKSTL